MAKNIKSVLRHLLDNKTYKTKDLLSLDVFRFDAPSLKRVARQLINVANQRLRRLEKKGIADKSPVYRGTMRRWQDNWINGNTNRSKAQTSFSLRGANTEEDLKNVINEVKQFLKAPSSTITGVIEQRENVVNKLGAFESDEQEKEFWDLFNRWQENHRNISERFNDSFQIRDMLYNYYRQEGRNTRGASWKLTRAINKMLGDMADVKEKDDLRMRDELKDGKVSIDNKEDF